MNCADLQNLLDEATPGPLSFHKRGQRIYGGKTGNVNIAQISINPNWEANAKGMAQWRDLARRVIAAERLAEALSEIAKQKKTDELETEHDAEVADFEGGYDACIDRARAAVAEWDAAQ